VGGGGEGEGVPKGLLDSECCRSTFFCLWSHSRLPSKQQSMRVSSVASAVGHID